jgi:hypothetical protein
LPKFKLRSRIPILPNIKVLSRLERTFFKKYPRQPFEVFFLVVFRAEVGAFFVELYVEP